MEKTRIKTEGAAPGITTAAAGPTIEKPLQLEARQPAPAGGYIVNGKP